MRGATRRLANVLSRASSIPGHSSSIGIARPMPVVRQALVQAVDVTTSSATILMGGATTPSAGVPYKGFPPGVGEVVNVHIVGDSPVIDSTHSQDGWKGPWNAPWGQIGYDTGPQVSGITADQTVLEAAITTVRRRNLRITVKARIQCTTASGDIGEVKITDLSNAQIDNDTVPFVMANIIHMSAYSIGIVSDGTETGFRVRVGSFAGSGTIIFVSSGSSVPQLFVDDMGPSQDTP